MNETSPSPTIASAIGQQAATAAVADASAVLDTTPGAEPKWAKPAIAIFAMLMLAGVIVYAVIAKDHDTMMLCVGSIISMATGAGNYYLGSSSGSDRKTNLLAAAPPITTSPGGR